MVSWEQLRDCGLSADDVRYRVARGRLHRWAPRVYAVGHTALTLRGRQTAALLFGGDNALLSHHDAAEHHGLMPAADRARVHVTLPRRRRSTPRIHVHVSAVDAVLRRGLPVTAVGRTIVDMADLRHERDIQRMLDQAHIRGILDLEELEASAVNGRRGAGTVRRAAARHRIGLTVTRSQLEEAFLALVLGLALPPPDVNRRIEGYEADFSWRDRRLIVETDGLRVHTTPDAFARDRRRDRAHRAAGWRVERITWADVHDRAFRSELRRWLQ